MLLCGAELLCNLVRGMQNFPAPAKAMTPQTLVPVALQVCWEIPDPGSIFIYILCNRAGSLAANGALLRNEPREDSGQSISKTSRLVAVGVANVVRWRCSEAPASLRCVSDIQVALEWSGHMPSLLADVLVIL